MKINILNSFSLNKLLFNKKVTIPLSIIMAFVFWLIIMISQNPVREQVFSDVTISMKMDNTTAEESGMGIVSDISEQKFTVTLSGPNYIVSSLKNTDFSIYASAAEVTAPGEYNLEVFGTRASAKSGYTFVSIVPSVITVNFDYIDSKEFTITPKLIGVGAADGLIAEAPVVGGSESDTLTIKGPRTVLNTIDSVVAYSEVNKTLSSSQSFDAKIVLYNADGAEIDQSTLTLGSSTVKVTQPISKKATVRVQPTFSNMPSGMSAADVKFTVDHETVTVIGTPSVVDEITKLSLSPIDFSNISVTSASNSFDVSPTLPEGIKVLDNIDYFKVTIDTTGYIEKTFTVSNIKYTGLSSGLTAKSPASIKNVKICGPAASVKKVTAADLYAVVDLTDKSAGEHTVTARIKSDTYTNVWQAGVYSTTVTIN